MKRLMIYQQSSRHRPSFSCIRRRSSSREILPRWRLSLVFFLSFFLSFSFSRLFVPFFLCFFLSASLSVQFAPICYLFRNWGDFWSIFKNDFRVFFEDLDDFWSIFSGFLMIFEGFRWFLINFLRIFEDFWRI